MSDEPLPYQAISTMHDTYHSRAATATRRACRVARAARFLAILVVSLLLVGPIKGRAAVDDYPGSGTLRLQDGDALIDAVLLDATFTLDVRGLLGELALEQTFSNTTDRWLDGEYLFPLPANATIRGLELRIADRIVIGRIMEKEEAAATFEQARDAGQSAGLVEQQRPNLFTARVANVAPGAEIRIRLDVLLPVSIKERQLSLTLPTTLTPRFASPGSPAPSIIGQPILPASVVRGPRMTLAAHIEPLVDHSLVESDTHRLDVESGALTLPPTPMDRDLELRWPFPQENGPEGLADGGISDAAFSVMHGDDRYVQLFMAPPARLDRSERQPRELVLVIDKSGSMAGQSIDAAREAAQSALDGLEPGDRFDLVAFDDRTRTLFDSPQLATGMNLAAGRRFLRRLSADGGTEMAPALARALSAGERTTRTVAGSVRQVVFLTDGSITDEDGLLRQIRRDLGTARLFTVGIGNAPNAWLLDKAAEVGGGTSLAIRDIDDVEATVTALLDRLEEPVLTDITVQFPGGADSYPARVPDLYADSPLMIVARLQQGAQVSGEAARAIITGWQGETRFRRVVMLPDVRETHPASVTEPARSAPALAMHWASMRIATLLDEQRESRDDERHRDAITALALDVGLVTPYTSFVAMEAEPVRPTGADSVDADVANLMPAGNTMLAIRLPQGAAGIDTLGLLGVLSGLLGGLCLWVRRSLSGSSKA